MSATLIRRVIEVAIAIFCLGAFLQIGRAAAALFDGRFGTLRWPVQASAFGLEEQLGQGALVSFPDGLLSVTGQPFWHGVDLLFSLGFIAIAILALVTLRKVLASFAQGDFVNATNANAMRKIGLLLLAICVLSLVHVCLLQGAILANVEPIHGTVLHPSISWDAKGMANIWLHYDPPVFTFLLGGLALLFGEAIRSGLAYRTDSESVV